MSQTQIIETMELEELYPNLFPKKKQKSPRRRIKARAIMPGNPVNIKNNKIRYQMFEAEEDAFEQWQLKQAENYVVEEGFEVKPFKLANVSRKKDVNFFHAKRGGFDICIENQLYLSPKPKRFSPDERTQDPVMLTKLTCGGSDDPVVEDWKDCRRVVIRIRKKRPYEDREKILFSVSGAYGKTTIRGVLNATECLKSSEVDWWDDNKILFEDQEHVLRAAMHQYARSKRIQKMGVPRKSIMSSETEGYEVYLPLLKTNQDVKEFEKYLVLHCTPKLERNKWSYAHLLYVTSEGDLLFTLDSSVFVKLKEYLGIADETSALDITVDPTTKAKLFRFFIENGNVTGFIAKLPKSSGIYRIQVVQPQPDHLFEWFYLVEYLDIGLMAVIHISYILCTSGSNHLPSMLHKLPRMAIRGHLYDFYKEDHEWSRLTCTQFGNEGIEAMIQAVQTFSDPYAVPWVNMSLVGEIDYDGEDDEYLSEN